MNKKEIINFIKSKNIWYESLEHKKVYTMEELEKLNLPHKNSEAKNLFVRDDKKKNYYLIIVSGTSKINLKEFSKKYNTRHLSFASEEDLMNILKLTKGSVSPLGILNDKNNLVKVFIDSYFINKENIIGVHPNDNTMTIWLRINDLINIIKEHGNIIQVVDI